MKITSLKDHHIHFARQLNYKKTREQLGACLVENEQILLFLFKQKLQKKIKIIFIKEGYAIDKQLKKIFQDSKIAYFEVLKGIFDKISTSPEKSNIIAVVHTEDNFTDTLSKNTLLVLDQINDHGNIGSLIRTACAFGISDIILISKEYDFYFKKTISASRGLVFKCQKRIFDSSHKAITFLKNSKFKIITTTLNSQKSIASLEKVIFKEKIAIVVGNETNGVSNEMLKNAEEKITIPMNCDVESLNVVVAAGIILQRIYEIKEKMENI